MVSIVVGLFCFSPIFSNHEMIKHNSCEHVSPFRPTNYLLCPNHEGEYDSGNQAVLPPPLVHPPWCDMDLAGFLSDLGDFLCLLSYCSSYCWGHRRGPPILCRHRTQRASFHQKRLLFCLFPNDQGEHVGHQLPFLRNFLSRFQAHK